jgi:hypothetical protein
MFLSETGVLWGAIFSRTLVMIDDAADVEHVAYEMIDRLGVTAAHTAYEQADIAAALFDVPSANTWCDIADAIERLWPTLARH